jgi:hypothetical protein
MIIHSTKLHENKVERRSYSRSESSEQGIAGQCFFLLWYNQVKRYIMCSTCGCQNVTIDKLIWCPQHCTRWGHICKSTYIWINNGVDFAWISFILDDEEIKKNNFSTTLLDSPQFALRSGRGTFLLNTLYTSGKAREEASLLKSARRVN